MPITPPATRTLTDGKGAGRGRVLGGVLSRPARGRVEKMLDFTKKDGHKDVTSDDLRMAAIQWQRRMEADPLHVHTYADQQARLGRGVWSIRTPEEVLFDQKSRVAEMLNPLVSMHRIETGLEASSGTRYIIANSIQHAQPILWDDEIRINAALMKLPKIDFRTTLTEPLLQFWSYPFDIPIGPDIALDDMRDRHLIYNLVMINEEHVSIAFCFGENEITRQWLGVVVFNRESTFPDDYLESFGAERINATKYILSMLLFITSPYITTETRAVPRGIVRSFGKRADDYPKVTFAMLRKIAPPAPENGIPLDEAQKRQWRHQWMVSGHIRNQWYPSIKAHRTIYIPPYAKGPKDLPLLTHAYRVAR